MTTRHGGRLLADCLVAQGVTHAFAVPGESFLPVLDGLYDVRDRITLTTCRTEQGAAHMAEAFGKLTARPAAAFVTRGPGACQASIGCHVAHQDGTPMLLFVGQIPFAETDRDSFQEVDYRKMFAPLAKWVTQVDQTERIPELVAHAAGVATTGRPGPVVIALSEEMQQQSTDASPLGPVFRTVPHPDPAALDRLEAMLAAAQRPLAILGGLWTEAGRAGINAALADRGIPTTVAFRRQSLIAGTSPLYAGDLGVGADPALVAAARDADLVLALGTRLGEPVTQGYTLFGPGSPPLVHVHPDPAELGRWTRPTLAIASDLTAFATAWSARPATPGPWSAWAEKLRATRLAAAEPPDYPHPLNVARLLRELETLLAPDAVMTTDAGNFATWPSRFMHLRDAQRLLGPTCGAMGYAVPAAVAASIAHPGRQTVAFVGDGGFLMTGQEISTALHHGATPIVMVFDNAMYGTIRMYQERQYPGRISGTALTSPDFAALARAYGGHGEHVTRTEEFAPAFRRARASGKPAVIALSTDPLQITTRTRLSG